MSREKKISNYSLIRLSRTGKEDLTDRLFISMSPPRILDGRKEAAVSRFAPTNCIASLEFSYPSSL